MRALYSTVAGLVAVATSYAAVAADVTQHISGLQPHPDLPLPSAARVVTAVVVTLALAAGTLVLVKRYLPKYAGRVGYAGNVIKVVAHSSISRSLRVHVIEVDTNRVLIVEGRGGIGLTVLHQPPPQPPASESQARS